jgi:uncharacterized membrane protein YebE (DUF533 family)
MAYLTLGEIATGCVAYLAYNHIRSKSVPEVTQDDGKTKIDEALAAKIEEIRKSGGANENVMQNLRMTLLKNGIDMTRIPPQVGNDPIAIQAYWSIVVDKLLSDAAAVPTFHAPYMRTEYKQSVIAERLAGWKALQGTATKPQPQGDRLSN